MSSSFQLFPVGTLSEAKTFDYLNYILKYTILNSAFLTLVFILSFKFNNLRFQVCDYMVSAKRTAVHLQFIPLKNAQSNTRIDSRIDTMIYKKDRLYL